MANWSDCEVILTGHPFKLAGVIDYLKSNFENIPLVEKEFIPDSKNCTLTIYGSGRWQADQVFFERLVSNFELSGTFMDSENGSSFFKLVTYKEGCIVDDIFTVYYSVEHANYLNNNQYFLESLAWIFEDEDWKTEHEDKVKLLLDIGYTIEELEEYANE